MKLLLIILCCFAVQSHAFTGKVLRTFVDSQDPKVMLVETQESSIVFELPVNQAELVGKLQTAQKYGFQVTLETNGDTIVNVNVDYRFDQGQALTPMTGYEPSNVATYEYANAIFKGLYRKHKWFNQCFNRAHIWAKQMYDQHNVKSMKVLIYYTRKYRKEVDKKWWFHIAPVVTINGSLYVMDREFTRKPITVDEWEKVFTVKIKDKNYRCKLIDNIAEYYDETNMRTEYCNIQFASMYYWEPNDMSKLDKTGEVKDRWVNWELRAAAKEAFWSWKTIYRRHRVAQ